jgi:tight adherence protein B
MAGATEYYLFAILVFGATALLLQALLFHFRRRSDVAKSINRRLALAEKLASQHEVLQELQRERGIENLDWVPSDWMRELWVQSGLRLDAQRAALLFGAVLVVVTGVSWFAMRLGVLALVVGPIIAAMLVLAWLNWVRSRRIEKFGEQLPDAIDIIVRSVRAGHPFSVAVGLVAREMPDPLGTEFGMAADEIAFGLDVRSALQNLNHRAGQNDLKFLVVALAIQSQTGGNLAELLARLSKLIRDRFKLRRRVRALSAEGRLSGLFLTLMPFILFGVISLIAPGYFRDIADHPVVPFLLATGIALLLIANVSIYKMVNFRF